MQAKCPTCSRLVDWNPANTHRPFCSERCKLIDLGAWLAEEHRVPGEELPGEELPATDEVPPAEKQ